MDVVIVPLQVPLGRELLLADVALKFDARVSRVHVQLQAAVGVEHVVADPAVDSFFKVTACNVTPKVPAAVELFPAMAAADLEVGIGRRVAFVNLMSHSEVSS